jgi:2-polyprenyl-3-methyl-5-hydroxy-6-metoxy-1,4-benzoquinol methylase
MLSRANYVPRKDFIEYGGCRFHKRADGDAYELALSAMTNLPGAQVLDLGAGAGLTSARMADAGYHVRAFDIAPEQFVPQNIAVQRADLNQPIEAADACAHGVLALEVLEHLENPSRFVREVGRLLVPDGVAVFSTPNIVSWKSKLRFLFSNEFELFFASRVRDTFSAEAGGHISPLLPWMLDFFFEQAGLVRERVTYTRSLFGLRSAHLGTCMIVRARKAVPKLAAGI